MTKPSVSRLATMGPSGLRTERSRRRVSLKPSNNHLDPAFDVIACMHAPEMSTDCPWGETQEPCDLFVMKAACRHYDDLSFTRGQFQCSHRNGSGHIGNLPTTTASTIAFAWISHDGSRGSLGSLEGIATCSPGNPFVPSIATWTILLATCTSDAISWITLLVARLSHFGRLGNEGDALCARCYLERGGSTEDQTPG